MLEWLGKVGRRVSFCYHSQCINLELPVRMATPPLPESLARLVVPLKQTQQIFLHLVALFLWLQRLQVRPRVFYGQHLDSFAVDWPLLAQIGHECDGEWHVSRTHALRCQCPNTSSPPTVFLMLSMRPFHRQPDVSRLPFD
jgi:hypothetical protein